LEPPLPVEYFYYKCDKVFHVRPICEGLVNRNRVGFIVSTETGRVLWAELDSHGSHIIESLNEEACTNETIVNVSEEIFTKQGTPTVSAIVIVSRGHSLRQAMKFSLLLDPLIIKSLQIGDFSGSLNTTLSQAVNLCSTLLMSKELKWYREQMMIKNFASSVKHKEACFGVEKTLEALQSGVLQVILISEDLDTHILILKHPFFTDEKRIYIAQGEESKEQEIFVHYNQSNGYEEKFHVIDSKPLIEWLYQNRKLFDVRLEILSAISSDGQKFLRIYDGIGGIFEDISP